MIWILKTSIHLVMGGGGGGGGGMYCITWRVCLIKISNHFQELNEGGTYSCVSGLI